MSDIGLPFFPLLDSVHSSLTPKQRKIAAYLRGNYREAVFHSLARAASEAGVSEASIIRFARALGYDGFSDMQAAIQEYVSASMQTTVERYRSFDHTGGAGTMWESLTETNVRILQSLPQLVSPMEAEEFASTLKQYSRILVTGFESTAAFAEYTSYYLSRAGYPAETVTEKSGNLYPLLQRTGEDTLVLSLMVARYPGAVVQFCRSCCEKGARLAVISDTPEHPLRDRTSFQFSVAARRSEGMNFDCHIAMLSFLQLLMLQVGLSDRDITRRALDSLEEFNRTFRIYD